MSEAPKETRPQIHRRTYLVYPKLQLAIVFYAVFLSAFCLIGPFAFSMMFKAIMPQWPPAGDDGESVSQWITALPLFLTMFAALLYGVVLSNRVVGPIYRVNKNILKYLEGGGVESVKFRKGDFWVEFGDTYNRMIESLPAKPVGEKSKAKFEIKN